MTTKTGPAARRAVRAIWGVACVLAAVGLCLACGGGESPAVAQVVAGVGMFGAGLALGSLAERIEERQNRRNVRRSAAR